MQYLITISSTVASTSSKPEYITLTNTIIYFNTKLISKLGLHINKLISCITIIKKQLAKKLSKSIKKQIIYLLTFAKDIYIKLKGINPITIKIATNNLAK